jgi:hypothetical protein
VSIDGSKKEGSSEETSEEDRKEEIVLFHLHTRFKAGGEILQPLFLRPSLY